MDPKKPEQSRLRHGNEAEGRPAHAEDGEKRGPARDNDFTFRQSYYQLSEYVLDLLTKLLKVNILLHAEPAEIEAGDIFLFNHFARFETFIPPYLIYKHTGRMSHSVASSEFFHGNDASSRLLRGLGAVPNDLPNLFSFLAAEIIKGSKVIVFPEGGMVKDRRVVDRKGNFGVYSRTARERRKHHAGASVIAHGLEIIRESVQRAKKRGNDRLIASMAEDLGPGGREKLLAFAERPVKVVPANITFYPIRVDPNLLEEWAEMIAGGLSTRARDELRIEGNILLRDTDMDIRLGRPSEPGQFWNPLDRAVLEILLNNVNSIGDAFDLLRAGGGGALGELVAKRARKIIYSMRDQYMRDIYTSVSVNLSQLASLLVFALVEEGRKSVKVSEFHRMLYLSVKKLQPHAEVALHRSLVDLDYYSGVEDGTCQGVREYIDAALKRGLFAEEEGNLKFLDKLWTDVEFDRIRIENPIAVYANEVRPQGVVNETVVAAMKEEKKLGPARLAMLRFDDEQVSYRFDKFRFSKQKYREINSLQEVSADTRPYLLKPENPLPMGVLLIHGFSSSPGEMRPLGDLLFARGHAVLGVRLKGHGTSPWDLKERSREDWAATVERGRRILSGVCDNVALVGFSMGGLLALKSAAESPSGVTKVVSACAPIKFRDRALGLVEMVHRVNRIVEFMAGDHGLKIFHQVLPENPELNYRHMPIDAIHELNRLAHEVEGALKAVSAPALILQADRDPTTDPVSAETIMEKLGSAEKRLMMVESKLHGIVYRNIGGCNEAIAAFLDGDAA